jgi:hypothetical protein
MRPENRHKTTHEPTVQSNECEEESISSKKILKSKSLSRGYTDSNTIDEVEEGDGSTSSTQ